MSSLALRQSDFLKFLQGENTKYVILAVNLLLVVWIASRLAALTWGVLSPAETAAPAVKGVRSVPLKNDPDRQLISQLPGWHLMGVVTKQAGPAKTAIPQNAPDTRLKLTLRGALASDDPASARAIVAGPTGKDEQYSIGDTLPGKAELSEIFPDRVILKRNGRYETLRLPRNSRPGGGAPAPRRLSSPAGRQDPAARLAQIRRQAQNNPGNLAGLVRATPQKGSDGKLIGYSVAPGSDPAMFADLGLKNGDVILQINGLALNDLNNAGQAMELLKSGSQVTLTLLRNGQEQTLTIAGR